jgi:hypothetical protein
MKRPRESGPHDFPIVTLNLSVDLASDNEIGHAFASGHFRTHGAYQAGGERNGSAVATKLANDDEPTVTASWNQLKGTSGAGQPSKSAETSGKLCRSRVASHASDSSL